MSQLLVSSLQITHASARDAPLRAAAPALCGHSSFSFARETHASCVAAVHAVEKCASARNLLLNRVMNLCGLVFAAAINVPAHRKKSLRAKLLVYATVCN